MLSGDPGVAANLPVEAIPKPARTERRRDMTLSDASAVSNATAPPDRALLTREDRARLLRYMTMMRAAEERGLALYKQGKVPGSFYDGRGQEAIAVGATFALGPRDRLCILHRDLGAHFVRGVTPDRYLANYMGRTGGVTGGKDGNMHFGDRAARLRRDGLDAARHGAGRQRDGPRLQDARRAARGDDVLRRGLDRQRAVARGDEPRRDPPPADRLRPREQPVRLLDARTSSSSRSTRSSTRPATAFPGRTSTATTSRRCSRRRRPPSSAPATARDRP